MQLLEIFQIKSYHIVLSVVIEALTGCCVGLTSAKTTNNRSNVTFTLYHTISQPTPYFKPQEKQSVVWQLAPNS